MFQPETYVILGERTEVDRKGRLYKIKRGIPRGLLKRLQDHQKRYPNGHRHMPKALRGIRTRKAAAE